MYDPSNPPSPSRTRWTTHTLPFKPHTHTYPTTPEDDSSSGGGDDALAGSGAGGALSEEEAAALRRELEALGNHIRFFKNGKDQGPAYSQLIGGASC